MCAPTGFSVGGVPAPVTDLRTHPVPDAVDAEAWALRVTGAVDRSLRLSAAALESFPLETVTDDFACAEGWVADGLAWRGIRVGDILERAGRRPRPSTPSSRAMDGDYACSFPLEALSDAILAVELDGEPLPVDHGGPARLVPTGPDRDCWTSVKWVSEIRIGETPFSDADTAKETALSRLE